MYLFEFFEVPAGKSQEILRYQVKAETLHAAVDEILRITSRLSPDFKTTLLNMKITVRVIPSEIQDANFFNTYKPNQKNK